MRRFRPEDTMMALIDHQTGTNKWASTTPLDVLERNVVILAKFAAGAGIPVVLTSSQEDQAQGPLMPELRDILPEAYAARIQRTGIVNAWDEAAFVEACRRTGRNNILMAGVTTEVCVAPPAAGAVESGFEVQVVCDACGSRDALAEEVAWRRIERAGAGLTSLNGALSELALDWSTDVGRLAQTVLRG